MPFSVKFPSLSLPLKVRSGSAVAAVLRAAVSEDMKCWEDHWKPRLGGEPSGAWPWQSEIVRGTGSERSLCVTLAHSGCVQGIMSLTDLPDGSLAQKGDGLVYVDLVSSAPWNRSPPVEAMSLPGVGTILIGAAYALSTQLGYRGRVGLHSKPEADSFYRDKLKMREFAAEDLGEGKMVYFELEPGKFPVK